jgi:hypothetical protein
MEGADGYAGKGMMARNCDMVYIMEPGMQS